MDLSLYSLHSLAFLGAMAAAAALAAESAPKSRWKALTTNQLIALGTLIVASLTASSTGYFGWREDRREAVEAELRVRELELRIAELERSQPRQNSN